MKSFKGNFYLFFILIIASSSTLKASQSLTILSNNEGLNHINSLQSDLVKLGLTKNEIYRSKQLADGARGLQSPQLDPLGLLGIEARNDAERRHYAELWVKQEYERTEKELKFQREVDAAWKRLMPNMLPVNMGNAAGIAHDSGGRLALFVREADCQRCDARLSAVLADKRPVDIYLVDSEGSDQKLRNWAQQHRIPAEQVRERRITLNHDAGRWMRYGNGIMPVLLQQGESGWHIAAF